MFIPIIPIVVPYFTSKGLNMQEFLELQAIFGLAVAILEVPSGYLADLWGRKKTLIVASVFSGIGFTSLIYCETYFDFLIYEIILAVALAMTSGTDFSLLYDSLALYHKEDRAVLQAAIAKRHFLTLSAEAISGVLAGIVVAWSISAVVYFNALCGWVPLLLILFVKEVPMDRMDPSAHLKNLKRILKHIFASERLLRMIFINFVVWSLSTFTAVWLLQRHWQQTGISLSQFGYLWAVLQLIAAFSGRYAIQVEKKLGTRAVLLLTSSLPIVGYIGLGTTGAIGAILFSLPFYFSRGLTAVIFSEALNWRLPSEFRATANSLNGLSMRLIFFVLGPIIGIIIDKYDTKTAALSLAALYVLLLFVLLVPMVLFLKSTPQDKLA